jgi:LysM repeat protein
MTKRPLLLLLLAALLVSLLPVGTALADSTPADCADGQWEVRPNQTLGFIAFTCGTTVSALVDFNHIQNPNLINTGQIILIPPSDFQPGTTAPAAPTTPPPAPAIPPATGGVTVVWGTPLYTGDGKIADIPVTVRNNSVNPAIAGGRYFTGHGVGTPDGPLWITLLGAIHADNPYPYVTNEPLWHATVHTDDGRVFPAYVGCKYLETVYAVGDEPLSRADNIWFHWEVTLPGGWFDCGNAYQVKPEDLAPGQTGSSVLTVYLTHPRDPVLSITRRVTRVDLELFTTEGRSLGTVSSQTFP